MWNAPVQPRTNLKNVYSVHGTMQSRRICDGDRCTAFSVTLTSAARQVYFDNIRMRLIHGDGLAPLIREKIDAPE